MSFLRVLPLRHFRRLASSSSGTNPQLQFPCLDHLEQKNLRLQNSQNGQNTEGKETSSLDGGPEPSYLKVSSGFKLFHLNQPIFLDNGGLLREYDIAYETWGTLNATRLNIVLLHTGLSALSHAKSQPNNTKPGWWESFIGPNKYLDTNKFFVVCTNVLGGCYGSTGPLSRDPASGDFYATRFPILSVNDMVRAQRELVRREFGAAKLWASVGASMGGMQSLAYALEFPTEVEKVVSISGCARLHPYLIALRHTQRQVLMADPNWNRGFYYGKVPPHIGMKLAREIATVTYRLGPEWESRFGRNRADEDKPPAFCPDFLVETYLDHAGEKFCLEYDANSLLYVLKAMDMFDLGARAQRRALQQRQSAEKRYTQLKNGAAASDSQDLAESSDLTCLPQTPYKELVSKATVTPAEARVDLEQGMRSISHKDILVVGVELDILFPVWQQREIALVLRALAPGSNIRYYELGENVSNFGHDTFLLSVDDFGPHVRSFLDEGLA